MEASSLQNHVVESIVIEVGSVWLQDLDIGHVVYSTVLEVGSSWLQDLFVYHVVYSNVNHGEGHCLILPCETEIVIHVHACCMHYNPFHPPAI
jgi:hypothetical protein